jgi:hypothetical protein
MLRFEGRNNGLVELPPERLELLNVDVPGDRSFDTVPLVFTHALQVLLSRR